MAKAKMTVLLGAPAAEVWSQVGGFGSPAQWHPVVDEVELSADGKERTLRLANGATTKERLISADDATWQYQYTIVESRLPVRAYVADFKVWPASNRSCTLTWEAEFDVSPGAPEAKVIGMIEGIFNAARPALIERFGAGAAPESSA